MRTFDTVIEDALVRRVGVRSECVRLFAGNADGISSLVVDKFGPIVRIETTTALSDAHQTSLVRALTYHFHDVTGVVVAHRDARGKGRVDVVHGQVPHGHVTLDDGRRVLVRTAVCDALGCGLFLDQRRGRALAAAHAAHREVLNLFAHAGSYGVAMAAGGAARVDQVDMSRKAARWASVNLALNGFNPRSHRFIVDDAFKILERAAKKRAGYGVVVCDPPTTAIKSDGTRFVAKDELVSLASRCLSALGDDGLLVFSCNDRRLDDDTLMAAVDAARAETKRRVVAMSPLPFDDDVMPDHVRQDVSTRAIVVNVA